jgi:prepilin-type N-terminal cleavage/methylation domain-containing protein
VVLEHVLVLALGRRGFTAVELLVVIAIIGAIAAMSTPSLVTYWRVATTKAGAQELAAGLNRARQLAIALNQGICVEVMGGRYRYRINGCGGAIWTAGAGANGFFTLANNVLVTANANPVFDYLGGAVPAATFTVANPNGGPTRSVVVSASGRVQIP